MELTPLTPTMGTIVNGTPGEFGSFDPLAMRDLIATRGAVLFRGMQATVAEFEDATKAMVKDFLVHHGMGRKFVSADGTTQTVAPGSSYIPAHTERGYACPIPRYVFFYCVVPGSAGGETTVYDGCGIYDALDAQCKAFFHDRRLLWKVRVGREVWERTLAVADPDSAARRLANQIATYLDPALGETSEVSFRGEMLEMAFRTPAVRQAHRNGRLAFANSALSYLDSWQDDNSVELCHDDGSPFPMDLLERVRVASEGVVVPIKWCAGDLIAIDNLTVLHGRRAIDDPSRRVLIRIGL